MESTAIFVVMLVATALGGANAAADQKLGLLGTVSLTSSGRYVASLNIGTPAQTLPLLFDISQPYTWVRCSGKRGGSNTFRPHASSTYRTTKRAATTTIFDSTANLATDTFTFNKTDGKTPGKSDVGVKKIPLYCAGADVLIPSSSYPTMKVPPPPGKYVSDAGGVVGFARHSNQSLPSLLPAGLPQRFAYCLITAEQVETPLLFGVSNYTLIPWLPISGLIGYMPLLKPTKKLPWAYRVQIRGIKVAGKDLALDSKLFRSGLEISTTVPYTKLVRPAYVALREAFRAAESGIPRVAAVAPFETCYNSSGLGFSRAGPPVNPVEFTLNVNRTAFIFYGWNSMVFVEENVMCLGFVPGGRNVLGTFQQGNVLVEVDLSNKRIGFTPPLSWLRTGCAAFNFTRGNF